MSATASELLTDRERPQEAALEPQADDVPKRQVWRRLEEIEDERRLRDELADWDDFSVEN